MKIRVTRNTRFERIAGLAGLQPGMTSIEAIMRRSGGGGRHGGDDDGGGGSGRG